MGTHLCGCQLIQLSLPLPGLILPVLHQYRCGGDGGETAREREGESGWRGKYNVYFAIFTIQKI